MGLKSRHLAGLLAGLLVGCATMKEGVGPADREAQNQTWYYDCCNPSLQQGDKELCKIAAKDEDHILWDTDGNKYVYIWSDCEIGKERWREWED